FYTDAGLTTVLDAATMATYDLTQVGNDLYIDDGAGGSALAFEGGRQATVTLRNVEKGGKDLGTHTFGFMTAAEAAAAGVDDFGTTLQDFMDFLNDVLGLDDSNVNGQTLGGGITFNNGQMTITGNEGTVQDLDIESADLV